MATGEIPVLTRSDGEVLYSAPTLFGGRGSREAIPGGWRRRLDGALVAAVMTIGLFGLVISFTTVRTAFAPSLGRLAWMVPIGIDLAILVFSAVDWRMAVDNMRTPWLRFVPWTLLGATVYLNVAPETAWWGRVGHAVMPTLWALAVELGTHVARVRAGLAAENRMESVRKSRWLLAPLSTARLRRRMILWEIREYDAGLAKERDRVLALVDLQERYGPLRWRFARAARRERALYRLGELAPSRLKPELQVTIEPSAELAAGTVAVDSTEGRDPGKVRPARTPAAVRPRRIASANVAESISADLLELGRRIAADLQAQGERVTRDRLTTRARETGASLSNRAAGQLLAQLREEGAA